MSKKNIIPASVSRFWEKRKEDILKSVVAILIGTPLFFILEEITIGLIHEPVIELKDWVSILGNFSQFVLVLIGCLVFYQIKIAKDDLKIRCIRESRSKSVEIADIFAKEIIPQINDFKAVVKKDNYQFTHRDLKNYFKEEIVQLGQKEEASYKKDTDYLINNKPLLNKCITILNSLEALAINFTKGIADEQSVFSALSQTYCNVVRENSSILCFLRNKEINFYTNVVELYSIWSNRMKHEGLLLQSKGIQEQLVEANQASKAITPIGIK